MRYERVAMLAVVGTLAVWAVTCKTGDGPPPPVGGPPSVDAGVDMHTVPGHAAGFTARITIPDGASASNYKWTMSWGDGSADSGTVAPTGMINAAHSYANVGSYVARLAGQGPDPADTAADTITVHVDDASAPQILIGAGDIAECKPGQAHPWVEKTAAVIDTTPGTVFTVGDNAYDGDSPTAGSTTAAFANCYNPYWGAFKKHTHPTPGNHEYQEYPHDSTADGYFGYFGVAAHAQPTGWYSYDLGSWHIIVLNSNFENSEAAGRAIPLAAQLAWLDSDLAAHPATCTLAMWHHPRFSSGVVHGNDTLLKPFWQHLYDGGADVILVGHEHNYERFAPQTPDGVADPVRGIREFVVGTGGGGYDSLDVNKVGQVGNSEVGGVDHGLLKLTLLPGSYQWQFVPVGYTLPIDSTPPQYSHTDSGAASCH